MIDEFPPNIVIDAWDGTTILVMCLTCDGVHESFVTPVSIERVNESIAAHVTYHLHSMLMRGGKQ